MLSDTQRRFVETRRVGHLATADAGGAPFLTPVCFGLAEATLYVTIDEKPKRNDLPLKRVRNIIKNPQVAFVVDRWDENWTPARLGDAARPGRDFCTTAMSTIARKTCCAAAIRNIARCSWLSSPVIALRIAHVANWGDLSAD